MNKRRVLRCSDANAIWRTCFMDCKATVTMSKCSITQDENLVMLFHKTPATPIKSLQRTPRSSSGKRALFRSNSNSLDDSEDLGPMSPLSVSSSNLSSDPCSPCFSPNGKFSTPPRTPIRSPSTEPTTASKTRKIEVKSSLFPNLKVHTPKTASSPTRRSQRKVVNRTPNGKGAQDILRDLSTPPRSGRKRKRPNRLPETDEDELNSSSQTICDSTPRRDRSSVSVSAFGIREISSENFYGPSAPVPPKPRMTLFPDVVESENDGKKRVRSLSLDSSASNRIFVSGTDRNKRRKTETCARPRSSRQGRQKGPHIGVWHGIKKPKKMKFAKNVSKAGTSLNARIAKMLEAEPQSSIQVKLKPLLDEKPRRKIAQRKKSSAEAFGEDGIIDPFPNHLIKRKRLPSSPHPSTHIDKENDSAPADPDKKFMKYKHRKATFTLNENVRLEFKDGVMRLGSPKKRRKLYSGKNDAFIDFCDDDDDDEEKNPVEKNIENILSKLQDDDKDAGGKARTTTLITKISEDALIDVLENPQTEVRIVQANPAGVLTEIQNDPSNKILSNLSSLEINDVHGNASAENGNILDLELTANMISSTTKILSDIETILSGDGPLPESGAETKDDSKSKEKFYSVFYKENWNNAQSANESTSTKTPSKKKPIKVPDDQYLLDAGQKSVGIVTCGKCGVMYQAGDFADEATHRKFHEHLPELRFTSWANERVVGKYHDGRVIMISPGDPKSWKHKVSKIVDIVDQELGFPEGSVSALSYKTVYLFINEKAKQIVGCLIAEECKEAYKMFPPLEGVDVDSCSKDPTPCRVGISRIWTALNHRRCGVAKRMIDCLQRTFFFGEIIPIDSVAFSVPSPSGKLLAQSVTGKLDFLVYGFA